MSSTDNRVVKMSFDNAQFEKGAQTSLNTIEKLKQALNFTGAAKGLNELQNSTRSFDMSAMANGVQTIADKFNALGVIGFTVLQNLTNSAIEAGKNIASALTIDPIKMGFEEYETQINAVQTILANTANKGTTLAEVNAALDELNTYADKTIYNFTEMARNIGTFTAAGIDLKTATNSIQGIANLAAVSGSTAQQASTAMYQLSQALASGTVKLMDWNSVVNAGMGGQVFQDALKETARVHGIAIDEMIESEGSFRETLQKGWLTADVLTETLEKFTAGSQGVTQAQLEQTKELWRARGYSEEQIKSLTGSMHVLTEAEEEEQRALWRSRGYTEEQIDAIFELGKMSTDAATKVKTFSQLIDTTKEALQSGWTQSWEYIIGDFEQAKELWTEISDILNIYINRSADARNAVLKEWSEGGGREAIIISLRNTFQALLSVMIPVKEAFNEIFPPITAQQLIDFSNKIKDFTASLKLNDEQMVKLKDVALTVFGGIKSVLEGVYNVASNVFNIAKMLFDAFRDTINVDNAAESFKRLADSFKSITETIKLTGPQLDKLRRFFSGIIAVGRTVVYILADIASAIFDGLNKAFGDFMPTGDSFLDILASAGDVLVEFSNRILEAWHSGGFEGFRDAVMGVVSAIEEFFSAVSDAIDLPRISENIKKFLDDLNFDNVAEWFDKVTAGFRKTKEGAEETESILDKVGQAIGNIVDKIKEFFKPVTNVLSDAKNAIENFFGGIDWNKIFGYLQNIVATGALVGIVKFLNDLPGKLQEILKSGAGVPSLLDQLGESLEQWQKTLKAAQLLMIAGAIFLIAGALVQISQIPPDRIVSSLGVAAAGIGELLGAFAAFSAISGKGDPRKAMTNLLVFMGMAAAINDIARALVSLSELSPEQMAAGVAAIGGLMLEVVGFMTLFSKIKEAKDVGFNMLILATSIVVLAEAMKKLSGLSWEQLAKGLVGVAGLMVSMALAMRLFPKEGRVVTAVGAMVVMAAAIRIMAGAVEKLGNLNVSQIVKGLGTIGILLAEMTIALRMFPKDGRILSSAAAIMTISIAMNIFGVAVEKFGSMDLMTLAKGLGAIGVVLLEITVALRALPDSGKLLASSVAIVTMAVSLNVMAMAVEKLGNLSIDQLAKGLISIAALLLAVTLALRSFPDSGKLIASSAALLVMTASLKMMAGVVEQLGNLSLGQLAKGLGAVAVALVEMIAALYLLPKDTIAKSAGLVVMALAIKMLVEPLQQLGSMSIAEIAKSLIMLGGSLFILAVGAELMGGAIAGAAAMLVMAAAIRILAPALVMLGNMEIGGLVISFAALAGAFLIFGVAASALAPTIPALLAFAGALALIGIGVFALSAGIGVIANLISNVAPDVSESISNLLQAVIDNIPLVGEMVKELFLTFLTTIQEIAPEIIRTLLSLLTELLQQLAEYVPQMADAGLKIILGFLQAIADNIQGIVEAGISIAVNFINGVASKLGDIIDSAFNLIISFINGLADAIRANHNALFDAVGNLISAIAESVLDLAYKVVDAGGDMLNQFIDGLGDFFWSVYNAGANLVQGFIDGLLSGIGGVWDAACSLADQAWNAITGTLDEHSPSRLTFGGGLNFVQGFINGMDYLREDAGKHAGMIGTTVADSLLGSIDTDYHPTITPVMDLSNIQNGSNSLNKMVSSLPNAFGIDADVSAKNAMMSQAMAMLGRSNDYSSILNGMADFREDMAEFMNMMANLQIVMDSGVLVGELAPSMDGALGYRQVFAGRGVL